MGVKVLLVAEIPKTAYSGEEMLSADKVVPFDVDDTLVIWGQAHLPEALQFVNHGSIELLVPHTWHMERLVEAKKSGAFVVVWSQNGAEWAKEVVTKLGLSSYVDLVCRKPSEYWDDLHVSEWMTQRQYGAWQGQDSFAKPFRRKVLAHD